MNIGINLYSKWPYEEVISAFIENGINRTFVCVEHPQFDDAVKALGKANIRIENFHAPFKNHNDIWVEGEEGDKKLKRLCDAVDKCTEYNVKLMVAHVSNGSPMPEITGVGLERFDSFMEYAREKGVMIAYESHRFLENVKYFMERYREAGFCLDNCHEYAFTPGVRYMPLFGDRLVATHISDNDCIGNNDKHMLPFDGVIDFDKAACEIAENGKDVTLMLEIKPDNHEKYKDVSIKDYYAEAAKRLKRFEKMVESYK